MNSPKLKPSKDKPTRVRVRNPNRTTPGQLTEDELIVKKLAAENTPQERVEYTIRYYEYQAPFNYDNVNCELGREGTGTGAHPDGMELDIPPYGAVTVEEDEPIIQVSVIGSPCIPPGTVLVYGEPYVWTYGRSGVKYKQDNLWGEHLYEWGASKEWEEGNRHCGLCSASFDLPECRKVTIMGYGQLDVHQSVLGGQPGRGHQFLELYEHEHEDWWNDAHFNIRAVRIGVRVKV